MHHFTCSNKLEDEEKDSVTLKDFNTKIKGAGKKEVLETAADHMGILKHGSLPKLDERHSGKHTPPFMSLGLQHKER